MIFRLLLSIAICSIGWEGQEALRKGNASASEGWQAHRSWRWWRGWINKRVSTRTRAPFTELFTFESVYPFCTFSLLILLFFWRAKFISFWYSFTVRKIKTFWVYINERFNVWIFRIYGISVKASSPILMCALPIVTGKPLVAQKL